MRAAARKRAHSLGEPENKSAPVLLSKRSPALAASPSRKRKVGPRPAGPESSEIVYKSSFRSTPTFFEDSLCNYRRMEEIKEILLLPIVLVVLIAVTRRDRD